MPSRSGSGRPSRDGRPSGLVVVMDPATGEVLAMANEPGFNGNTSASMTAT
jgi:cell division protein FtsI/penicillin-binding protein 2